MATGERPFPYAREDGGGPARRIEQGFGKFERSVRVPGGLNPEAIEASPVRWCPDVARPEAGTLRPRRIEIKAGANEARHEAGATACKARTELRVRA